MYEWYGVPYSTPLGRELDVYPLVCCLGVWVSDYAVPGRSVVRGGMTKLLNDEVDECDMCDGRRECE